MSRVIYTFYRPRSRFSPIFFSFFSLFFFFLKCVRVLCLLVSTGPHLMSSDFTCTNPFGPAGAASGEHVAVMEWRERSAVSCDEAYAEAQRWVEAVTKKKFGSEDFRSALENGVLLCDLINKITPGVIRRVNRLPTPIAGLDNLNVFLKACRKLGLKEAQLFHPGDLQDLSTRVTVKHQETDRRLKNVLITIYWLGRRAQCDRFYDGPFLNLKAFEGLLGTALYKALQESSGQKGGNVRDSGFGDSWCSEREELFQLREGGGGGGGGGHRRDDSLDSLDSLSISSDSTLKGSSEGFCSDAEADSVFRMTENKSGLSYRRSVTLTPKPTSQFNQFLPTKDKSTAYVPAPLRKKRAERNEDSRRSWANLTYAEDQATLTSETRLSSDRCGSVPASPSASPHLQWAYESGSDSDADRPDPDLVLDDLASRRFHSPSPAPPANFAVPASSLAAGKASGVSPWTPVTMTPNVAPQQSLTCLSSSGVNSRGVRPPQQGSVRVDHSLFREIYDDSEDEDDDVGYADPVQDDLYSRKLGVTPQPVAKVSYDKFLPKFWTPEEDTHIQKIKLGSQKRPWYKKMQGFSYKKSGSSSDDSDCDVSPWLSSARSLSGPSPPHTRTHEASAHASLVVGKRSKSASDIQVEPNIDRQSRYEELQKHRQQTKDTEDKWQDDLSKWKNRRRSVNSDIVKKKEEREKTEESTSGSRRAKTFKEMQEERENKGKNSIGGRLGSLSYLDNEDVFDKAVISPRTRTLPARSYTIDTPYYSSESPEPPLKEDEPRAASPATGRAAFPPTSQGVETLDSPAGRDTTTTSTPTSRSFFHRAQSPAPAAEAPLPVSVRTGTVETVETAAAVSLRKVPEPRRPLLRTQTEAGAPSSGSLYEQQPQPVSMEPKPPGVSRVSASLPRSYQKPDSARLTSIVAPRPFGTQSSRLTYVPRALTVDDPQKRVNGDAVASKKSAVPSRFQQFMTSEDELQSQSSSAHSSEDEEEEEEEDKTSPQMVSSSQSISTHSVSSPQRISPVPPQVKTGAPVSPAPAKETSQENFCESRISLNQKPNSSRDFGFQAAWDSTGACVASIQPGSPAEMCQLQAGDEVLTVNGHQVAEMSYPDWKSCMEEALQEGSLIMDIRHHGRNNWDRDQPPMPFKIHKTINLTSVDHPILLGSPDANAVSSSLDFTSHASVEKLLPKEAPAHPVLDMASNGVNGGFREQAATMTNKESEPISLTNLKRRSEFFEKGGSESAMPDIPVPSIIPSSSRWSWDPEEERRRQEKWQKEQERLLQEKYKRDQEKLQEEWLKDQEEVAKSVGQQEPGSLEVSTGAGGPLSSLSPVGQPATPPWEEQERKRKEEHERQRQAEERRKREEEERELRRLQEERETRDRQQRQEEERKSRDEEELRWQRRKEEEREEERRRRQEAEEQQRRERERALAEQQQQQQRAASFANVPPSLSFTDRMKSKSSPQLDEEEKPQRKGVFVQPGVMAPQLLEEQARSARDKEARSQRAASELEMERRNILNIMRYREPERVTGGVAAEKKGQQSASQAEQERQQILNEMKKKTPLLMDKSWIRQQSSTTSTTTEESDVPPMRRGESLDNLDASYNSWRSSWTPRSNSYGQSAARPNSALSGSTAFYGGGSAGVQRPPSSALPSSYSMGSLRAGAGTPSSPWSRQSPSPSPSSPSPTTSPEPTSEGGPPQQRSRSVSGRKVCTFCDTPLGKGAAMIIESLGLCYHLSCFKCIECKSDLGGSAAGAEVRIRNKHLYCNTCYTRCKAGQPTTM